jgi:cytochrome c oxidase assembly factor 5
MRKRFRGNKPISTSKELEGGGGEEVGMLYAGKSGKNDKESELDGYEKWVRNDGVEDIRKK